MSFGAAHTYIAHISVCEYPPPPCHRGSKQSQVQKEAYTFINKKNYIVFLELIGCVIVFSQGPAVFSGDRRIYIKWFIKCSSKSLYSEVDDFIV